MFRHPLIIVLVLIVNETNADFWCPGNVLKSLVNCLYQCDQEVYDDIGQIRCRIDCGRKADCFPKPWALCKRKIQLAREFAKCIIGCADYFKDVNQPLLDLFSCDVGCRNNFDDKLHELITKPFPWFCSHL